MDPDFFVVKNLPSPPDRSARKIPQPSLLFTIGIFVRNEPLGVPGGGHNPEGWVDTAVREGLGFLIAARDCGRGPPRWTDR